MDIIKKVDEIIFLWKILHKYQFVLPYEKAFFSKKKTILDRRKMGNNVRRPHSNYGLACCFELPKKKIYLVDMKKYILRIIL